MKFSNYFTASDACTPARGTLVSGLYAHQSWMLCTRPSESTAPSLNPAFPTYGKLLRRLGYETPYIGKWHLSNAPTNGKTTYLHEYGFDGLTIPDPLGEGTEGYTKDPETADQAIAWLKNRKANQGPFCLTLNQFIGGNAEDDTQKLTAQELNQLLYQRMTAFRGRDTWQGTFIDNHDQMRTLVRLQKLGIQKTERERRMDLATVLLMTVRGIPIIFYGDNFLVVGPNRSTVYLNKLSSLVVRSRR